MTWFTDIQPLTNHQRKHLWADRYDGYQRFIPTELRSLRSAELAAVRNAGTPTPGGPPSPCAPCNGGSPGSYSGGGHEMA